MTAVRTCRTQYDRVVLQYDSNADLFSALRSTQPCHSCGGLSRRDHAKHVDIDGQALVWCAAKRSKTVVLAQPRALFALPTNAGAGVSRCARTREGRCPLPRAGYRARARFLPAVPSPDVPHSLPVLLDVSTVRAAVPLQLGDARVAQAHGGRLRSRTSSAEGVGAARAALQRARGERRDAPLSRWRCAVLLGYSPAHRSCARQSWRQAAIFGVLDISCSSYARASAGARRSVGVVSDASGARVVLLSTTDGAVY